VQILHMKDYRYKRHGYKWVPENQLSKGPNGDNLCRYCGKETPRKRMTFCSEKCVHEWRIRSEPSYARQYIFERDKGVCAICGWDTEATRRKTSQLDILRQWAVMQWLGIPPNRTKSWWDADHIVPVVDGGGGCGLDGYRTLCIPCHKKVSAELKTRLAERNKPVKENGQLEL
jgi:5-methylcytosine-specific restriction protein A